MHLTKAYHLVDPSSSFTFKSPYSLIHLELSHFYDAFQHIHVHLAQHDVLTFPIIVIIFALVPCLSYLLPLLLHLVDPCYLIVSSSSNLKSQWPLLIQKGGLMGQRQTQEFNSIFITNQYQDHSKASLADVAFY